MIVDRLSFMVVKYLVGSVVRAKLYSEGAESPPRLGISNISLRSSGMQEFMSGATVESMSIFLENTLFLRRKVFRAI